VTTFSRGWHLTLPEGRPVIIYLSLLVAIIGLLAYALSNNPKVAEIGRISYGCGLLAFLLMLSAHPVSLLPR
jgi:hypothetical protein